MIRIISKKNEIYKKNHLIPDAPYVCLKLHKNPQNPKEKKRNGQFKISLGKVKDYHWNAK